jgi:putative nucleotidyltransferase with HDIG domain
MIKTLDSVYELFPEVDRISDEELRQKVLKTWLEAWKTSDYDRLDQTPFLHDDIAGIDNVEHTRAVTIMCIQFAETLKEFHNIKINMDYLIAGAILHDLGKIFEYSESPSELGRLFTHPISAMYFATKEDLPLEVIHIIETHSLEGELVKRSPEAAVVHYMDFAYAETVLRAKTDTSTGERTKFHVIRTGV